MAGTKPVSLSHRATPYDRPAERAVSTNQRRDSTSGSVRRSLSNAFGRIVGRPDKSSDTSRAEFAAVREVENGPNDSATESILIEHPSNESRSDISQINAPSLPRRAHSLAALKPQINWSMIQSSPNMCLPAHVIVEAYREALENRALQQKVLQRNLQHSYQTRASEQPSGSEAERPHEKLVSSNPDKSLPSMIEPVHGQAEQSKETPQQGSSYRSNSIASARGIPGRRTASIKPKRTAHSVSKRQVSRPIRSRIQLVSRPLIDISKLPEERKKAPGFYTANFDISSSDDEDEDASSKEQEKRASKDISKERPLLRRPQVESTKLKNRAEPAARPEKPNTPVTSSQPDLFGNLQSRPTDAKKPEPSTLAKPEITASAGEKKPLFSFGKPTDSQGPAVPAAPAAPFGAPPATAEPTSKPVFSFGQSNAKPSEAVPKPSSTFSFGAPTNTNKEKDSSAHTQQPSITPKPPAQPSDAKPTFSFLSSDKKPEQQKSTQTSSASTPAFSFGGFSSASKPAAEAEPAGPPPAKRKFDFSKSAEKVAQQPALLSSNDDATAGQKQTSDANAGKNSSLEPPAAPKPTFAFGSTDNSAFKPAFSFGTSNDKNGSAAAAGTATTQPPKASTPFTFGTSSQSAATESKAATPAFSFGGSKPAADQSKASTPAFTFGASSQQSTDKGATAPASGFSFGATSQTPSVSTESKSASAQKPAFTFDASSNASNIRSKPAFGASSGQGAPSFGQPAAAAGTPAVSGAPVFGSTNAFGKSNTPAAGGFQFGKPASDAKPNGAAPAAPTIDASKPTAPANNSSTAAPAVASSVSSPFQFGAKSNENQKSGSAAPPNNTNGFSFTFGSGSTPPAGPFKFGATGSGPAAVGPAAAPTFGGPLAGGTGGNQAPANQASRLSTPTFGAPASSSASPAPAFTFGQSQPAAGSTTGGFQFGKPNETGASQPAFGAPAGQSPAPFTFGAPAPAALPNAPASTTPAAPGFTNNNNTTFGSRESTPGAGAPIGGRKLAQVKRRLGR